MPTVYLTSSGRNSRPYALSGAVPTGERYFMKRIADQLEPYLLASGIHVRRSGAELSPAHAIDLANREDCDLYLALYSATAPANLEGAMQGPDLHYYTYSREGERAAMIFARNLRTIYPEPIFVSIQAESRLPELRHTKAPAILADAGYHDNPGDARWIAENTALIAYNLALSVTEYLGVPLLQPDA